jgi:luciferase family oxidoreductase group 1
MSLTLSVLDQSMACAGRGEDHALRDTLDLAAHCEALGYHRFWVSEHHGLPTIVGSAPEILLAAIAARTQRIRLGSAGVMLPHYSAFKVAEQFRVLDALAPGRIDLGVGRAPGSDMRTAHAAQPARSARGRGLSAAGARPDRLDPQPAPPGRVAHPRAPRTAQAGFERAPEVWVLGSSDYGAQLAAHFGLPYAFAYFFMDGQGVEQALALYRQLYKPSDRHGRPQATICIWALVADSDAEAVHHARSRERWRIDRQRGVLGPLQRPTASPSRRRRRAAAGHAPARLRRPRRRRGRAHPRAGAELQLDEIVVNTWAHDPAVRRRSYALLAREFGIGCRP